MKIPFYNNCVNWDTDGFSQDVLAVVCGSWDKMEVISWNAFKNTCEWESFKDKLFVGKKLDPYINFWRVPGWGIYGFKWSGIEYIFAEEETMQDFMGRMRGYWSVEEDFHPSENPQNIKAMITKISSFHKLIQERLEPENGIEDLQAHEAVVPVLREDEYAFGRPNKFKIKASTLPDNFKHEELGSCMYAAELLTKKLLDEGVSDFKIVEGYVCFNDLENYDSPKEDPSYSSHTWIELKGGKKLDLTLGQFKKWSYDPKDVKYVGPFKKYTPEKYLALCVKYPEANPHKYLASKYDLSDDDWGSDEWLAHSNDLDMLKDKLIKDKLLPSGGKVPLKNGKFVIVSKEPRDNKKWRVTSFEMIGGKMTPTGHEVCPELLGNPVSSVSGCLAYKDVDWDKFEAS